MRAATVNRQELRVFGLTLSAGILIAPAAFCWLFSRPYPWKILGPAAFLILLLAILKPRALKWIQFVFLAFAQVVGWFNARILLGTFFYLCFSPIAWVVRKKGGPLELEWNDSESYFVRVPPKKTDMRKTY